MPSILKQMQKERKTPEETQTELEDLIQQKDRVEERIRRVERNHMDDRLSICLGNLRDISDSLGDIQNALNLVWKRTKQVEEEVKQVLSMPSSLLRPGDYPQ
jgi:archaellum component FlaC